MSSVGNSRSNGILLLDIGLNQLKQQIEKITMRTSLANLKQNVDISVRV